MWPGKTSLMTVQTTGPIEKAKSDETDQREQSDDARTARPRRRRGAGGVLRDESESDAHHDQADPHPDQPGEQQLPPPRRSMKAMAIRVARTLTAPIAHVVTIV